MNDSLAREEGLKHRVLALRTELDTVLKSRGKLAAPPRR